MFDEQKWVFDVEIKKVFEYCNVLLEEIIEWVELVVDKDDNIVLIIDKLLVLILYKFEFLYLKGKVV